MEDNSILTLEAPHRKNVGIIMIHNSSTAIGELVVLEFVTGVQV